MPCLAALLLCAASAATQGQTVNSEADLVSALDNASSSTITLAPGLSINLTQSLQSPASVVVLDGQGSVIDGGGVFKIFSSRLSGSNPLGDLGGLKNITFQNSVSTASDGYGGAMYIIGDLKGGITSVNFINNVQNGWSIGGGAIAVDKTLYGGIQYSSFINNRSNGNYGGALMVYGNLEGGISHSIFSGNALKRDSAIVSGVFTTHYGGAVGISGKLSGGISDVVFIDNRAESGHPLAAGFGGAVSAYQINGGIHDSRFERNRADHFGGAIALIVMGGDTGNLNGGIHNTLFKDNYAGQQGGAIFASGDSTGINGGIHSSSFIGNVAGADGGAIIALHVAGGIYDSEFDGNRAGRYGGAIAVLRTLNGEVHGSNFTNNQAGLDGGAILAQELTGGIEGSRFTGNTAMRYGGAIAVLSTLNGEVSESSFTGNKVMGNGSARAAGLGGALFVRGDLAVVGSVFKGNEATTANVGDMTGGRGGAIFHDANKALSTMLLASRSADAPMVFDGNTHNPGAQGAVRNSVYFGTTATASALPQAVTDVTVDVAAGAQVAMYDALASQEDGLQNSAGRAYSQLVVNIRKTGAGTWVLGGHSDMRSASHWGINAGELFLTGVAPSGAMGAADVDLSHADSSFSLASGARLAASLDAGGPHHIRADEITLAAGSVSQVRATYGDPFVVWATVPTQPIPVLALDARSVLQNGQATQQQSGQIRIGVYDYAYSLFWDGATKDMLYLQVGDRLSNGNGYNAQRAGVSAVTAPGAIVYHNQSGAMVAQRSAAVFLQSHEPVLGNSLWVRPYFHQVDQESGGSRVDYKLERYGIALGYDRWLGDSGFAGLAFNAGRPRYESHDADVKSDDYTVMAYGGVALPYALELTGYVGYGWSSYSQNRRVQNQAYARDYDSHNWRAGAELGRRLSLGEHLTLRPFAGYAYLNVDVDGYDEGTGVFALQVDGFNQRVHRLSVGGDVDWSLDAGRYVRLRGDYANLSGDLAGQTDIRFVQNPAVNYRTVGNALSSDAFGLALHGGWALSERATLEVVYGLELAKHATSQQASLNLSLQF